MTLTDKDDGDVYYYTRSTGRGVEVEVTPNTAETAEEIQERMNGELFLHQRKTTYNSILQQYQEDTIEKEVIKTMTSFALSKAYNAFRFFNFL